MKRQNITLKSIKPLFIERMQKLLSDKTDFNKYFKILNESPRKSIRCNALKISPEELLKRLEKKGWKIKQPFKNYPEVMVIGSELSPGELGRSLEHLLGYYYVQEIASMLPVIALNPKPSENETVLDLAASPGSKTTQICAMMDNKGLILANDVSWGRLKILATNTNRCGCSNLIITKKDGVSLCKKFLTQNIKFDKILLDAPCSGEGTIRDKPGTLQMWNPKTIEVLSRLQKSLLVNALKILNKNGELVYSTCTHAPEENEEILNFILNHEEFKKKIKIEKINLPIKCRSGITKWEDKTYSKEVENSCRIYPHDNDTEGFFLAKIRKIRD